MPHPPSARSSPQSEEHGAPPTFAFKGTEARSTAEIAQMLDILGGDAQDWEQVMENPLGEEGELLGDTDPEAQSQPGVVDVKSVTEGVTLDNVPYRDL